MLRVHRGFTLIELLVVIAIIAILAAMIFPVIQQAKIAGQRAACISNLRQLGSAVKFYMDDYGRYPGQFPYVNSEEHFTAWMARIYKYVRNDRVYQCPAAVQYWVQNVRTPPYSGRTRTYKANYSYNEYINWQIPGDQRYQFESESKIRNPSSTALIADGYQHALFHDWNDAEAWPNKDGLPSGMNRIRYSDGPKIINGVAHWEIPLVRHGGPNIVFCDLHVANVLKDKFRAVNYPGANYDNNGICTCREYPIIYPNALRYQAP